MKDSEFFAFSVKTEKEEDGVHAKVQSCIKKCYFLHHRFSQFLKELYNLHCVNVSKYGPEKTPYLDTFHAVLGLF